MPLFSDIRDFAQTQWGQYILSWIVAGVLMWIGARLAGLQFATVPRALVAAVAVTFLTWTLFGYLSNELGVFGLAVSICLSLVVIKAIFETTWERAGLVWIMNAIAQFTAISLGYNAGVVQKSALLHYWHLH